MPDTQSQCSAIIRLVNGGDGLLGVQFLLSLVGEDTAAAVRERIGLGGPATQSDRLTTSLFRRLDAPRSVRLWMLEEDDPATNSFVYHNMFTADPITRDIAEGVPFGSAGGPLRVVCDRSYCSHHAPTLFEWSGEMVDGLRRARTMAAGRRAALSVRRRDWPQVAEADRAVPLPGFARWALAIRIDCPPEVRAQFGSHPKFTHRLRRAGIVEMREYVEEGTPAGSVLGVLQLGTRLFPTRTREAEALLAPLVRGELNLEAWAVLAQLLPTFTGTAAELVRTCAAITT